MVKIHKDAHNNCIFTSIFRRVLTATRRTLFYLTTSKLMHDISYKSAGRSSLNILCTVFINFHSLNNKFRSVSRLSVINQVFDQFFAHTVDLIIDKPRLPSSSVTEVLLRIVIATFRILMIVCILVTEFLNHPMCLCTNFIQLNAKQFHCNAFHVAV